MLSAILAVYVRDVYVARRRQSSLKRTSIGADRAAALRLWKEEDADVNKVYLIAPSPFQTWTSHYSHPRSELQPSFHSVADEQRMRELLTPSKDWWAGHREGTADNTQDSTQKLDFGEAPRIVDNNDLAAEAETEETAARPSRVVANGRKSSSRNSRSSRSSAVAATESITHTVTETVRKTLSKALSSTLSRTSSRGSRNSRASLRQQQQQAQEEEEEEQAAPAEPEAEAEVEEEPAAEAERTESPEPEPPLSQEEEAALSSSDSDDDERKSGEDQPASAAAAAAASPSPYSDDRDFAAGGGVGDDSDSDVEPASYPQGMFGYGSSASPPRSSSPARSERSPDDYSHLQSPGPADRSADADGEDGDAETASRVSRGSRGGRRSSGTPGRHRRQWTHTVLPGISEPRIHRKGQGGSRW